jgi:dynein light chain 1, axonemal
MAKATTIKDALKRWEEKTKQNATEAKEIDLFFQLPPIEKMDNILSNLVNCEKLSLSTNMVDKVYGIQGMKNLKILSVSRNYIKTIAGLVSE